MTCTTRPNPPSPIRSMYRKSSGQTLTKGFGEIARARRSQQQQADSSSSHRRLNGKLWKKPLVVLLLFIGSLCHFSCPSLSHQSVSTRNARRTTYGEVHPFGSNFEEGNPAQPPFPHVVHKLPGVSSAPRSTNVLTSPKNSRFWLVYDVLGATGLAS